MSESLQTSDIKPDEKFEEFLAAKAAKLPPKHRKETVIRLARSSFYGRNISDRLYPADTNAPPDITYPDSDRFLRPKYHSQDVSLSEALVREFVTDPSNWEKMRLYRQLLWRIVPNSMLLTEFGKLVEAELATTEEREFAYFVYRRQQPSVSLRSLSAKQIDRVHALVRRFNGVDEES